MTTRGFGLGVAVLAAVWGISTPARAISVMCSNPLGECEVSNDNFDSVTCDCGNSGEITGGGDEWETLSEAELLEICEAELEMCGEFDPSTSGGTSGTESSTGDTVGTETTSSTGDTVGGESSVGESSSAETGGEATGGEATGAETTGGEATGAETTGGEATGAETTGGEATGAETTGTPTTGDETSGNGSTSSATNGESTGSTGASTDDDDSSGESTGTNTDSSGCGCDTTGDRSLGGLALAALALLGRRARRR